MPLMEEREREREREHGDPVHGLGKARSAYAAVADGRDWAAKLAATDFAVALLN